MALFRDNVEFFGGTNGSSTPSNEKWVPDAENSYQDGNMGAQKDRLDSM